jgi:hypothetical protein
MAVRDSHVLHISEILGEVPFGMLAQGLVEAIIEAETEGIPDPSNDPAVMLFGAFIAFHTHADVNTVLGYKKLIELCRVRHETPQVPQ